MDTIFNSFQKDILLSSHTTYRIGGAARYFLAAQKKEDLIAGIKWAKENSIPFFILGGGSNVLISDKGFDGLVIKCQISAMEFKEKGGELLLEAGAGVSLAEVVSESLNHGWSGLEWALGIPGTLGGAICGNAGRSGQDMSQRVARINILGNDLTEKEILAIDGEFDYRTSRFKQRQEIILSAVLKFSPLEKSESEKLLREAQSVIERMPNFPSAGSVFKNYLVGEDDELIKKHPDFQAKVRGGKLAAGFLIQQCNLAGQRFGGAQIWPQHANFILNIDQAKAQDVLSLIELVKKTVKEKFNISLEEEVRKIGF